MTTRTRSHADTGIDAAAARALFDASMVAAGVEPVADRINGVYDNVLEMRRLAALVRAVVADDVEPAAIFDPAVVARLR